MMPPPPNREPHSRDMGARSNISIDSIERTGYDQEAWLADLQARGANIVQVTYPRTVNKDKELTVFRGKYLEVLDDARKQWKARNWRRQITHVPYTTLAPWHFGIPMTFLIIQFTPKTTIENQGDVMSETYRPQWIE